MPAVPGFHFVGRPSFGCVYHVNEPWLNKRYTMMLVATSSVVVAMAAIAVGKNWMEDARKRRNGKTASEIVQAALSS